MASGSDDVAPEPMAVEDDLVGDNFLINCWCGPRCLSTSLMYSFAQRSDTEVRDEPLYAHYLKVTGAHRPYRDQVMDAQEQDGAKVLQEFSQRTKKVLFAKHMGKMKIQLEDALVLRGKHMILVRDPYFVIKSFAKVVAPSLEEIGFPSLVEIYSSLRTQGRPPIVILSDQLAADPEGMLRSVCLALGLPFEEAMLQWEAGPKPYDGIWASWWYGNTHKQTGFVQPSNKRQQALTSEHRRLFEECSPFYSLLKRYSLKPITQMGEVPRPLSITNPSDSQAQASKRSWSSEPKTSSGATHAYKRDDRNADIVIGIRDGVTDSFDLVWRPEAKVSVLDSGFVLGDGVWEGVRLHQGVLLFSQHHVERLFEGAKALDMDLGITKEGMEQLIYDTCDANGMENASYVHIRVMVTRGLKSTPYQNPTATIGKPTIVIIPEYKQVPATSKERGINLFTTHVRRGAPDAQDPMLNTHSKHNCIAACIQANKVGADEALMLDPHGFVATCNSVNFFVVRRGELWAPTGKYQLHGITRENAMKLARDFGMPVFEKDFTLAEVYSADESFVTGTMASLVPVATVDGRVIGSGMRGPVTHRLQLAYAALCDAEAEKGRFPQPYVQVSISQIQRLISIKAEAAAPEPCRLPVVASAVVEPTPPLPEPTASYALGTSANTAATALLAAAAVNAQEADMSSQDGTPGASRKTKGARNIYFEHAKKSWETDPEFFLPDGTSWVEVTEEGHIQAQKRGVVVCWLCKLYGKVNSFTTGYIKGKKDALKAHMTISDHKELVEKWASNRKQPVPVLVDLDDNSNIVHAPGSVGHGSDGNAMTHRASSEDTHDGVSD